MTRQEKNYKLIYEVIPQINEVFVAGRKVIEAEKVYKEEQEKLKQHIIKCSGYKESELMFSDDHCYANGISKHVYRIGGPKGSGKNVCIFCGGDDFDD